MQINDLDYEEKVASLIFSRKEIHILRKAIAQYIDKESSEDNKWLHLQLVGVDDILKDGNFSRFLSHHTRMILKSADFTLDDDVTTTDASITIQEVE